nr:zinc finger protein 22-like [Parasteatoda tepidariorum]
MYRNKQPKTILRNLGWCVMNPKNFLRIASVVGEISIPVYSCDGCSYSTSIKSHLVRHRMRHTGERPFHCSTCGKGFITAHHLRYHETTHLKL